VASPLASNLTVLRRTPYGATTNGAEMRKTNPIPKCQGSSLKLQVSGRKEYVPRALTSNFKRHTSNSPPNVPMGGVACKTKPNLGELGYVGKGCRMGRGSAGESNVRNEANLARAPANGRGLAGRDARPECDCAKRTQFGPAGG
jgi:ribosomal protein L34E